MYKLVSWTKNSVAIYIILYYYIPTTIRGITHLSFFVEEWMSGGRDDWDHDEVSEQILENDGESLLL